MKHLTLTILIGLGLVAMQCKNSEKTKASEPIVETAEPFGYYSDYNVFIATDGGEPLVVPIDINWFSRDDGYGIEYKAWYGTVQDWPIAYHTNSIHSKLEDIPNESFEHGDTKNFDFDDRSESITVKIYGAPEIEIKAPKIEEGVLAPLFNDIHDTHALKTTIQVGEKERSGWMLYERIRRKKDSAGKFEGFAAFYWMPLVVDGQLYHFMKHRDELAAVKWSDSANVVKAEILRDFQLNIVETIADSTSKRESIPKVFRIQAPEWNFDITLKSLGEQVGYGKMFAKGLGYYRQSLLKSTETSRVSGYGMMELILEDD